MKIKTLLSVLLLSNLFSLSLSSQCNITNFVATALDCDINGYPVISFEFDVEDPGDDNMFSLSVNGSIVGVFEYGESSYATSTFGLIDGNCETAYTFTLTDQNNNDCTADFAFDDPFCCVTEGCNMVLDVDQVGECNNDGEFYITLLVGNSGGSGGGFETVINGVSFGWFDYGANLYEFGPIDGDCETIYEITVTDWEDEECTLSTILNDPVCCMSDCSFSDLTVEAIECTGDDTFSIELDFEYDNVVETEFEFLANGSFHGTYAYADLPIIITDFPVHPNPFVTIFGIGADVSCADDLFFEGLDCNDGICAITNVFAEAYACNDQGQIFVDIEFDVVNPGSSNQFTINGNGTTYGTFEYGQTFYTIGPFTPDCELEYEFQVLDVDNSDCFEYYIFSDALCCESEECAITTLDFGPNPECVDGSIVAEWLIDGENLSEVGFDIYIDDVFETYVNWNSDSWYDINIEDPGTELFVLKVCDNDNSDCCIILDVENPCYEENEECSILNLGAEAYECNEADEIYFDIFFDVVNPGADNQFTVVGNGNNYGTFEYGLEYYTVGPFDADCETAVELIVTDLNHNNCSAYIELDEIFCCEEEECTVVELIVETSECDEGTDIEVNFEITGGSEDIFITLNDDTYGPYSDPLSPITYISFLYETEYITVTVCDAEYPNCCETVVVLNPCYDDSGNDDCNISGLVVEQQECDEDGNAYFHLDFDYENVGADNQFTVVGNGNNYGTFEYGQTFYELGPIESNCDLELEFIVTDANNNDCSAFVGHDPLCCDEGDECDITELNVDPTACTDGNTFGFTFDLEIINPIGDHFDLFIENEFHDFYEYADLPLEANGLSYDSEWITVKVCDNDNEDCCAVVEFLNPCNEENAECNISEVNAEFIECNDNGEAFFHVTFDYANQGDQNYFTIVGNGMNYGTFEYGLDFYLVGPVIADCETILEFIVKDVDNENCSAFVEHDPACCGNGEECDITELNVDPTACTDGNTFGFTFDLEIVNPIGDHFDLFIENEFHDFYEYADLPLEVNGLSFDSEWITVKVCDNDNEDCCAVVEFLNPCNEENDECNISEVNAEFIECNDEGEAFFHVTFNYANQGDQNSFTIFGNGMNYGTFEYGLDFYLVGPVIADCETELEFIVTDVDNNNCSAFVEYDPACCDEDDECALLELSLDATECFEDNTFNLVIDIEVDGDTNDFFDLNINGEFVGFYEFDQLPLTLEDLTYDTENITVELCENDNPDCCLTLEIENPCGDESNQQFFINNIEVEYISCVDNLIMMSIDLDHGDNDDQFSVSANGISYGDFYYADLPIMIENIPADGITNYNFIVLDSNIDDLTSSIHIGLLSCDGDIVLDADNLVLDPANIKSIKAYDVTGKLLGLFESEENLQILNFDRSVSAGIIILKIDYGSQIVTKKIVRVN